MISIACALECASGGSGPLRRRVSLVPSTQQQKPLPNQRRQGHASCMFASRTGWRLEQNPLGRAVEERRRKGPEILDLTESNPTRCGFNYDSRQILTALANPRSLTYEPDPRGLLTAREAIAAYYAERGVKAAPEQIFLTTSTSEAYSYVFRLLADAGDELLVPSPGYPLFDFLAQLSDLELSSYPLEYDHGWRIDLAALGRRVGGRTRAILAVHPNNPTGSFVREREIEAIIKLCNRHSLALVADEVFADFPFAADIAGHEDGPRVMTHAGEQRALTFTLSGISKICALPQMKLAWIVASGPPDLLRDALARLEVIADTYLSTSAPLAHALPALLETRKAIQPQILERVRGNLQQLDEQLARTSQASRLEVEGGWYAVLKLPSARSDEDWAVTLVREEGVLAHPGHFFDFRTDGFLVLSLLPPDDTFERGVARILERVRKET
jgi:alanine-synthesizing transaminase